MPTPPPPKPDEILPGITDCLDLIVRLNRILDETRRLTAPFDGSTHGSDDAVAADIYTLAESAQHHLRDVRRDLQRIRIIIETLPPPSFSV